MNRMSDNLTGEVESASDGKLAFADVAQRPISINREGSGHTFNVSDTIGVVVTGLIALILLWSLLRSEARYRKMLEQTRTPE